MSTNLEGLETTTIENGPVATGFSAIDLFVNADWVVQSVMVLLVLMSFWSWTIIFSKAMNLRRLKQKSQAFETVFWSGVSLDALYDRLQGAASDPFSRLFVRTFREYRSLSTKTSMIETPQTHLERIMTIETNKELDILGHHLPFLASVGSTAPFVGLFGTVWGIIHSFQNIAASQSTNLAVVAPGIAEALFATALGLIAAIPAVLAYNRLSSEVARFGGRLDTFSQEFSVVIQGQLKKGHA